MGGEQQSIPGLQLHLASIRVGNLPFSLEDGHPLVFLLVVPKSFWGNLAARENPLHPDAGGGEQLLGHFFFWEPVRQGKEVQSNSTPSRVYKGKILPGHMGVEQVTVQNLEVVKVDAENNLIALKGAIPGPKGGIVTITDSVKA